MAGSILTTPCETAGASALEAVAPDAPVVLQNAIAEVLAEREPPLVSVIVRSIGRVELSEALESVAAQLYPRIEVIVVDALGSGHPPLSERCGPFPSRLVGRGRKLRRSEAANVGLEEARGRYIGFLDDDDWFLPNHVAALVAALQQHPEAPAAYAGVRVVHPEKGSRDSINEPYSGAALRCGNCIPLHAALFRRCAVDEGERFDERFDAYEDWDFWLRLSQRGAFIHVNQVSACYRVGGDSGVGAGATREEQRVGRLRVYAKWRELWTPEELNEVGEERNVLALALRQQSVRDREALAQSEARVHALEEQLLRIEYSWSNAFTKPIRRLRPVLKRLKRTANTQADSHSAGLDDRPQVANLARGGATGVLTGPLISVVVPVYNACRSNPHYLNEALESIYQQTYRSIEIVIVDDGSTDETPEVCKQFLATHLGIPIRYCRQENGGQSSSRNLGVGLSRGEWVSFLDQDDVWFLDKLERVVPLLSGNVNLVYTDADTIDEKSQPSLVGLHRNYQCGLPHPKELLEDLLFKDVFVMPGVMTVTRDLVMKVGGFDEALSGYEDDDLFLRVSPFASVVYLPESTLRWRMYGDNYSNTTRMIRSRLQYWKKLMANYSDGGRNRHRAVGISRRFFREFLRQAIHQRRLGMGIYRDNLDALKRIAPHLPPLERLGFAYPAPLWCAAAARFRLLALALEFIWRHTASQTR